jgi:DNA-binding NarL/FixJ family response regulator
MAPTSASTATTDELFLMSPFAATEPADDANGTGGAVRVVLADGDPISRQVLSALLDAARNIRLVAAVDSRVPPHEWPDERLDLAILVAGPEENHVRPAQRLIARDIGTLLVGVDWTKHRLGAAFASGVAGCLSKDWAIKNLGAAATAAAAGYVVISPDLMRLSVAGFFPDNGQAVRALADGRPVRELLGELTGREREVLTLLAEGRSTAEVSADLVVSPATVKSHVSHALTKLGVRSRLEAVLLMQAALGCG